MSRLKNSSYPDWVLKHKTKGTNISCIGNKYYLYKVSSIWNRDKKRAQKITVGYIGRITEDGIIQSKAKEKAEKKLGLGVYSNNNNTMDNNSNTMDNNSNDNISVKEYGSYSFLHNIGKDIIDNLKQIFPADLANKIFVIALIKLIHQCPFKRIEMFYNNSYLSSMTEFKDMNLSKSNTTNILDMVGNNRNAIVNFMKLFIANIANNNNNQDNYILFDGTGIISRSNHMNINNIGYNSHRIFEPQINLLYAFEYNTRMPAYYRIIPGNIRDISAFKLSLLESNLKNMVVIADKGFSSEDNFKLLDELDLKYIIPLRRNNILIDKKTLIKGMENRKEFDDYFIWNKRPIWYFKDKNNPDVLVFVDNELKTEEEKDYLNRIEEGLEGYTKENFLKKQYDFGTFVIKTNLIGEKTPEELYGIYKQRNEIEQSFDFLKNTMEQDKTYMQNEKHLEAWTFINHISLLLNYRVYNLLRINNKLKKYSIADILSSLQCIYKIRIGNEWKTSEINGKIKKLLDDVGIPIA
jgi:hypothetical protein